MPHHCVAPGLCRSLFDFSIKFILALLSELLPTTWEQEADQEIEEADREMEEADLLKEAKQEKEETEQEAKDEDAEEK